jgi:hypothetical protein
MPALVGQADPTSKQAGGESVSQSPLKANAFSTFLDQNPPFELRPEMGFGLRQEPVLPGPIIGKMPSSDLRKANYRRIDQFDRPQSSGTYLSSKLKQSYLHWPSMANGARERGRPAGSLDPPVAGKCRHGSCS